MKRNMPRHEVIQPQDKSIRLIALTQDKNAIVDTDVYDMLIDRNWFAKKNGKTFYALHNLTQIQAEFMHNLVLPPVDGLFVDHINRNGLDNRRVNLRLGTHMQNCHNQGVQFSSKTGYKGVCWLTTAKKFQATIRVNGKNIQIGRYLCPIEAARAYDKAAAHYFREFAVYNFPEATHLPLPPLSC